MGDFVTTILVVILCFLIFSGICYLAVVVEDNRQKGLQEKKHKRMVGGIIDNRSEE